MSTWDKALGADAPEWPNAPTWTRAGRRDHRRRRRRRIAVAVLVLIVLVVAAGVGAVLYRRHQRNAQAAANCTKVRTIERSRPAVTGGAPVLAVLGDSYAEGWNLANPVDAFPYPLARMVSRSAAVFAVAGSGYVAGGVCGGQQFASRVKDVVAVKPATVVVEGGINDEAADPSDVLYAASDLLGNLRRQLPDAQIVVLSPFTSPKAPNSGPVTDELRQASRIVSGVTFVDVSALRFALGADQEHPTVEGDRTIAAAVAAHLGS